MRSAGQVETAGQGTAVASLDLLGSAQFPELTWLQPLWPPLPAARDRRTAGDKEGSAATRKRNGAASVTAGPLSTRLDRGATQLDAPHSAACSHNVFTHQQSMLTPILGNLSLSGTVRLESHTQHPPK